MSGVQRHNRGCLRRRNVDLARPSDCASPGCKRRAGRRAMSGRRPNPGRTTVPTRCDQPGRGISPPCSGTSGGNIKARTAPGQADARSRTRVSSPKRLQDVGDPEDLSQHLPDAAGEILKGVQRDPEGRQQDLELDLNPGTALGDLRNRCPPGHRRVPRVQFDVGELQTGSRTHVRPTPWSRVERPTPSVLSEERVETEQEEDASLLEDFERRAHMQDSTFQSYGSRPSQPPGGGWNP